MNHKVNPIHVQGFLPYFFVFSLGLIFSSYRLMSSSHTGVEDSIESILTAVLHISLIISFWLMIKKFYILFDEKELIVKQVFKPIVKIPYNKIIKIFIRQDLIDKISGKYTMIIQFNLTGYAQKATIRAFGVSLRYSIDPHFPGIWGDLLTIPALTLSDIADLKKKLDVKDSHMPSIQDIGMGYPYYNTATRLVNILMVSFGLIISMSLIIAFIVFLATI